MAKFVFRVQKSPLAFRLAAELVLKGHRCIVCFRSRDEIDQGRADDTLLLRVLLVYRVEVIDIDFG